MNMHLVVYQTPRWRGADLYLEGGSVYDFVFLMARGCVPSQPRQYTSLGCRGKNRDQSATSSNKNFESTTLFFGIIGTLLWILVLPQGLCSLVSVFQRCMTL